MTESEQSLNEPLSAVIDGEAEELELRRVLNAVAEDPDLRAKWQRMHLIGSVVRREPSMTHAPVPTWPNDGMAPEADAPAVADSTVRDRDTSQANRWFSGRWVAPVGGAALAAAAALVVVLYFGPSQPEDVAPVVAERSPPAHGLSNQPTEQDLQRANAYIYQHARGTSINARPAAMPFVKELSTPHAGPPAPGAATEWDTDRQRQ